MTSVEMTKTMKMLRSRRRRERAEEKSTRRWGKTGNSLAMTRRREAVRMTEARLREPIIMAPLCKKTTKLSLLSPPEE
jgi:hypothetical protein